VAQGENGNWFFCKGCGGLIGFFPDGLTRDGDTLPPGSIAHAKPAAFLNVPNSVPCDVYQRLGPEELAELHKDAHPAEPPSDFRPMRE
jgi:hypothetical protein